MSDYAKHHDLAMKLFVGRALAAQGKGLPWSVDEDRESIIRERALWARLTPAEQEQAQKDLAEFWDGRGATRTVVVNPKWGAWTEGLDRVVVPDAAFGAPTQDFRPAGRGVEVLSREHPRAAGFLAWLWQRGFQPISLGGEVVTLAVPSHRIVQESERLVGALTAAVPHLKLRPWSEKAAESGVLRVRGSYDPATGQATLQICGVSDLLGLGSVRTLGE